MQQAYIINGIRTAVGNFGGTLAAVRTDDLAAFVLKELFERNKNVNFSEIDDVIFGCANQAGEDNRNVARMSLLLGGLPVTVPGATVNRLCGSGMMAVIEGARAIATGDADLVLAGGVESMSRAPWVMPKPKDGFPRGDATMFDTTLGWRLVNPKMQALGHTDALGETAEKVAEKYGVGRAAQDAFALESQQRYAK